MSEIEIRRFLGGLAKKNANARDAAFFLGAGVYNHYVSTIADQMLYRAEWLTSYTPYQPEVSQGTLQSIFEFQTHICLLTGLEVANASMYEGASALVEALLMAERLSRGKTRAVLSAGIHPEYRETVRTYFADLGLELVEVPVGPDGATDPKALAAAVDEKTFAVAVQSPNFYGVVEDWKTGSAAAQSEGRALGRRRGRGGLARAARPAGRGRRRHRVRRGAVARRADAQRRAAPRVPRLPHRAPAPDPGAARRARRRTRKGSAASA